MAAQRGEAELRLAPSFRCYSFESRCHDGLFFSLHRRPLPPLVWSSCFPRTIQSLLAASPCSRLSRPRSTINQSDFRQVIGSSSLCWLVRPYKLRLNPTGLPCSHEILRRHAGSMNPGSTPDHSPWRPLEFCLPHREIGSAASTTFNFGAILPFTCVPAYPLPVYASQCPLPGTTQDSVPGCWLSFTRAVIADC